MEYNSLISQIIDILQSETVVYGHILSLSSAKTDAIVASDAAGLENITAEEQRLVANIAALEKNRELVVKKLSLYMKKPVQQISISLLVENCDSQTSQKLKEAKQALELTIEKLRQANEINSKLIKNSLDYIEFSINILTTISPGDNNYGNSGQVNQGKKRNLFDAKG